MLCVKSFTLADRITLNEIRMSASRNLLPNSQAPVEHPNRQPRINDVFSLANNFKANCDLALFNMLVFCAFPSHIVGNPDCINISKIACPAIPVAVVDPSVRNRT
ncbi:hypothetical protein P9112_001550 [Eukaryota sp. TZLM1-RC]